MVNLFVGLLLDACSHWPLYSHYISYKSPSGVVSYYATFRQVDDSNID